MTSANDVIGLQRAIVELVTEDDARAAWMSDPHGYSDRRLSGPAARALARVDPSGMQAMTLSHVAKKERFDYFHKLHHDLEARKAAQAGEGAPASSPGEPHHDHDHDGPDGPHSHAPQHQHEPGADHGHGHAHAHGEH
jgi:hypothetical protein